MGSILKQGQELDVSIIALGAQGDGLARVDSMSVFVPQTAPGDQVRVKLLQRRGNGWAASCVAVLGRGSRYQQPPCQHYDRCGGCALQHVPETVYRQHKQGLIETALGRYGVQPEESLPSFWLGEGQRWRATLGFRRTQRGVILGFHERRGTHLVQIDHCLVLTKNLSDLLLPLRALLETVSLQNDLGSVSLLDSDTGTDVTVHLDRDLSLVMREALTDFARAHNLARLSWQSDVFLDVLVEQRTPSIALGDATVPVPAGVFLQASARSTQILMEFVLSHTSDCAEVADLFCGMGTFTVPLLQAGKAVVSFDADGTALDSLRGTVRRLRQPVENVQRRDLFRHPLSAMELGKFEAVVLDPPKQGARAQIAEVVSSGVKKIVYISCSPASFARDAAELVAAGYKLQTLMPVDQFTYAADMELAAVMTRP